jgi:hypothetical protein
MANGLIATLWCAEPNAISNAVDYAKHSSRSHDAVIGVYDEAGNVIETHEHAGEFKDHSAVNARARAPEPRTQSLESF